MEWYVNLDGFYIIKTISKVVAYFLTNVLLKHDRKMAENFPITTFGAILW